MKRWVCTLIMIVATTARAQDVEVDDQVLLKVARALDYLAGTQDSNGAWRGNIGYKLNYDYRSTEQRAHHVGITALACMAFMAAGNLPGRGKYGTHVERGLDYILSRVDAKGFISDNGSRMYSHAFATLMLAEVYGADPNIRVQQALKKATSFIVRTQNASGGWRYAPGATDSDMSIVVCQVQALRAARNVGISIPAETIRRAQDYVLRSARADGGFDYQVDAPYGSRDSFALAAAGVTALQGTALYDDHRVRAGLNYLEREGNSESYGTYFYFYGHYYAVQAMFVAANRWPEYWQRWYPRIRDDLVVRQQPDGHWPNSVGPGVNFSTAMSALILQIPYRYLPIFQR